MSFNVPLIAEFPQIRLLLSPTKKYALMSLDPMLVQFPPIEFSAPLLADTEGCYINSQMLNTFPAALLQLSHLKVLTLVCPQLRHIPPEIATLQNLIDITLQYCPLTELPPILCQMPNLQCLDLSCCELEALTGVQLSSLHGLIELRLACNNLSELPEQMAALTRLEVLNLESNQLESLPSEMFATMPLRKLCLKENPLQRLPLSLASLSSDCFVDEGIHCAKLRNESTLHCAQQWSRWLCMYAFLALDCPQPVVVALVPTQLYLE